VDNQIESLCFKHVDHIDTILIQQFDHYFHKDEKTKIPREWKSPLKINDIFVQAKKKCLHTLKIFENMILTENTKFHLCAIRVRLLKAERINDIKNTFERYCDNEYRQIEEMIRRRESKKERFFSFSNPIIWVIFLCFAWNEIWSLLKNPLLLILFILGSIIMFILYSVHTLGFDIQNVGFQIFRKCFDITISKIRDFIKYHSSTIMNHSTQNNHHFDFYRRPHHQSLSSFQNHRLTANK